MIDRQLVFVNGVRAKNSGTGLDRFGFGASDRNHSPLRGSHLVREREIRRKFDDLIVITRAKCVAHPFECAAIAYIALQDVSA